MIVGMKLRQGAVKLVGAGFRESLHGGPARAAPVGGKIRRADLHGFNGVRLRTDVNCSPARDNDNIRTVEFILIIFDALAGRIDLRLQLRTEIVSAECRRATTGGAGSGHSGS